MQYSCKTSITNFDGYMGCGEAELIELVDEYNMQSVLLPMPFDHGPNSKPNPYPKSAK